MKVLLLGDYPHTTDVEDRLRRLGMEVARGAADAAGAWDLIYPMSGREAEAARRSTASGAVLVAVPSAVSETCRSAGALDAAAARAGLSFRAQDSGGAHLFFLAHEGALLASVQAGLAPGGLVTVPVEDVIWDAASALAAELGFHGAGRIRFADGHVLGVDPGLTPEAALAVAAGVDLIGGFTDLVLGRLPAVERERGRAGVRWPTPRQGALHRVASGLRSLLSRDHHSPGG